MRVVVVFLLLALVACSKLSRHEPVVLLEVATCANVDQNDYSRILGILKEHGIEPRTWSSGLTYINVREDQASRARVLIDEAVQKEHLRLTVNWERREGMLLYR